MNIDERYKLIFAEHHYAIELREKILTGLCIIYAGLAGAFIWVQSGPKSLSWVVTATALGVTIVFLLADRRNRDGIRACKEAGYAIECYAQANIPTEQRFFERVLQDVENQDLPKNRSKKKITHSELIDYVLFFISIILVISTGYLWYSNGVLSPQRNEIASQPVTLYRNSVTDPNMRLHVATFDANEKEQYNQGNCVIAQQLFQSQSEVKTKFWCEKGRYKK